MKKANKKNLYITAAKINKDNNNSVSSENSIIEFKLDQPALITQLDENGIGKETKEFFYVVCYQSIQNYAAE